MTSTPQLPLIAAVLLALTLGCASAKKEPPRSSLPELRAARAATALAAVFEAANQVADEDDLETFRGFGIAPRPYAWVDERHPERRALAEAVATWPEGRKKAALDWMRENATWTSMLHALAIESFGDDLEPLDWGPTMSVFNPAIYANRGSLAPLLKAALEDEAIAKIAEGVAVQRDPFTPHGVQQRRAKLLDYLGAEDDLPPFRALYNPLMAVGNGVNATSQDGSILMVVGPMGSEGDRSMILFHEMAHLPIYRILSAPSGMAALEKSRCAFEAVKVRYGYDEWPSFFAEALVRSLSYRLEGVEALDTGVVFEEYLTAELERWETSEVPFEEAVGAMLRGLSAAYCTPAPCPAPFETLSSGTCMARPAQARADLPVAVFLHGMTQSASWAKGEGLRLAEEAGEELIVLAPLGRKGACSWSPAHHCWPQTSPGLDDLAESIKDDLREVQRALGRSEPIAPILVGFSNGAYGATALAFATDLQLGGLVVLNGGATAPIQARRDLPTLLRAAKGDEHHHPTMITLRDRLAAAGWSAKWEEREGGHPLDDSDLASIVRFVKEHGGP